MPRLSRCFVVVCCRRHYYYHCHHSVVVVDVSMLLVADDLRMCLSRQRRHRHRHRGVLCRVGVDAFPRGHDYLYLTTKWFLSTRRRVISFVPNHSLSDDYDAYEYDVGFSFMRHSPSRETSLSNACYAHGHGQSCRWPAAGSGRHCCCSSAVSPAISCRL